MRALWMVLGLVPLAVGPALAQDPVVVDSAHYKLKFENEHVRVLRITYGPNEESVMHYHPAGVAVFLVDQKSSLHYRMVKLWKSRARLVRCYGRRPVDICPRI